MDAIVCLLKFRLISPEALFVSKVFATFTAALSFVALVLHVIYALIRVSIVRTTAIFMLGSAGMVPYTLELFYKYYFMLHFLYTYIKENYFEFKM